MEPSRFAARWACLASAVLWALWIAPVPGQLIDRGKAPNAAGEGIALTLAEQIGSGRGDLVTPGSSRYVIARDPFRAIRRGRQLFQRKFGRTDAQGPNHGDGIGDVATRPTIGAGLTDSCAACHGRPRGSAGFGGDVVTRPDSRDAPHLFGLGLKEMLADEMTTALRASAEQARQQARSSGAPVTRTLVAKGVSFGAIVARADGTLDTTNVEGVDADLRIRPFFLHGGTISIREFVVGALSAEMGIDIVDPDVTAARQGGRVVTPSGMVLDGSRDTIEAGPDVTSSELDPALVDFLEFYLLNYFKPALHEQNLTVKLGRSTFDRMGCATCHVPDLPLAHDRRVADVETSFDPVRGVLNRFFAVARPLHDTVDDGGGHPALRPPSGRTFTVRNIFTDFKRHDLGPAFYERNYDNSVRRDFLTTPLWGVASTGPYGHDGRSIDLTEVILRHGGEAQNARNAFVALPAAHRLAVIAFLQSLVLFPPDDTASNLDPGDPLTPGFPQWGHGSIKLTVLFNNPFIVE